MPNRWDVLADDDEPITQGNKSAEAAATNGEGKKKRRRRRHKHAKKSNDDAGQLANPGGAVMKDLVEDCMSHGFSRAHIMKTIDVMWNAGLAYDKKEAVLAQLANKGGNKGKAATQGQKQGGGKKSQAAKAATKAATKAPAPAPAPAPAKAAAQDAQAPAAGAQGEEPRSTAEMLRTVAAHPDVQQVLVALLAWRRRASRDQVSTFFTCGALDTILENVLRQPSLSTVEQELRKLLLATLDGSESVVSDILSHLRTAITTFAGLEVAATEAEYATTRDEAIGAVAAQMSAAIAAFRRSLGSGATPGASGDAERARAAAAARLSKLPAASSDIGLRFRRRDLCFDIARADVSKCSAASVMTTTAADGSDGVANPALVSKVKALSPPASEEARARQATVRKRMDELRTQYETALAPVTEEEEKLDSQIDSLQARKEQLQKELQTVTAEIKAGRARRKELNAQRDSVALRFHGEVSTLNAEQQDLLTAVNRSEAAGALEECVKGLTSRLSEKAASAAVAVSRTASGQMARSRSQLFESVLAFLAAERPCMEFIRDRVFRTNQKLTALVRVAVVVGCAALRWYIVADVVFSWFAFRQSRELQGYQAMNMSELAASIGAQVASRKQEVSEDEQLLDVRVPPCCRAPCVGGVRGRGFTEAAPLCRGSPRTRPAWLTRCVPQSVLALCRTATSAPSPRSPRTSVLCRPWPANTPSSSPPSRQRPPPRRVLPASTRPPPPAVGGPHRCPWTTWTSRAACSGSPTRPPLLPPQPTAPRPPLPTHRWPSAPHAVAARLPVPVRVPLEPLRPCAR